MKAKKILFCTEASYLPTGYSVYTKEVLSRLSQDPQFEVAELACYCDGTAPEAQNYKWRTFPNTPKVGSPDWDEYNQYPTYQFGEYTFNTVLLKFQPDFVMDIRDWWMLEFQQRSPFRNFFHWAIMPTVDAAPQNLQWLDTYGSADAVFTYSEFGRDTLLAQSDCINYQGIASPCASDAFAPAEDKKTHKERFGVDSDAFIVGTVMRNQRRKLYPDLFKVFREFLNRTKANNAFLYCHTYFPDIGWQIPELLQQYDLTNRVLFTYKCKKCKFLQPSFFQDVFQACPQCNEYSSHLVGMKNKVTEEELAQIYNSFDVYTQYANSEGFGMPQLEAAQCGVPVISINYSAMQSVIKNIGALPIEPLTFYTECETGCQRAVPDNAKAIDVLTHLYDMPDKDLQALGHEMRVKTLQHYNWDSTAKIWSDYFSHTPTRDISQTWRSPSQKFTPDTTIPTGISTKDKINFLFERVLGRPDWIGGYLWKRTLKDVLYKCTTSSMNTDYYFNESHAVTDSPELTPFDMGTAHNYFLQLRKLYNDWDDIRINHMTEVSKT